MLLVAAAVGGIVIVFCGYVGYRLVSSTYYRLVSITNYRLVSITNYRLVSSTYYSIVTRPGQCSV